MNDASVAAPIVTAAILVIGDEILSGRTKDKNIGYIAEHLTTIGIDLKEVRVVPDDEPEIIAQCVAQPLHLCVHDWRYWPTHDDITADCVAKAFGVSIDYHPEAVALLKANWAARGIEPNEARMRMARIPAGAVLIQNKVSTAPGFRIGNVHVMAGVPSIMQAMLDEVAPTLKTGVKVLSESVRADLREGDIGSPLGEIAKAHPETMIGSYPFVDEKGQPNTNLVIRSRDAQKLAAAKRDVEVMLVKTRAQYRQSA